MQETIVAVCLSLAVIYIGYTFSRKMRYKGGGCCGCGKDCSSSAAGKCPSQPLKEVNALQAHDNK